MSRTRTLRLLRIALCAALIHALGPAILRGLAALQGKPMQLVCTAFGIKQVAVDVPGGAPQPTDPAQSLHCPFCLASQLAVVASSDPAPFATLIRVARASATPNAASPSLPPTWPRTLARAPPVFFA